MDQLTYLSERRKQYLELAKLYFHEVQKGSPLTGLTFLKQKLDGLQIEITKLEIEQAKEMND